MTFKLGKPPIVEGWIRVTFETPPESSEWKWQQTIDFLDSLQEPFHLPIQEAMQIPEPIVQKVDGQGFPTELKVRSVPQYFRIRTESRSIVVQVGECELLVSQMRNEHGNYPGFTPLLNLFMDVVERFRQVIPLGDLSQLEVHYVDIVRLKMPSEFAIQDYFDGAPELPATPYGHSFTAEWSQKFLTPDCQDVAELSVQSMRLDEEGLLPFRLDWHRWCRETKGDPTSIANRLNMAHNYLKECFRTVCKPPVWDSFEPN